MMKRLLLSLPLLFLVACGGKEDHDRDNNHGQEGSNETKHDDGKDGDMGHGDDHGDPHPLGKLTAHGRDFEVVQLGDIVAGKEGAVELAFKSGKERITTVRAWVGVESGEGSMKRKMDLEGTSEMHGHLEVPDPIPAGSKLWMSFDVDGKVETHGIAYK